MYEIKSIYDEGITFNLPTLKWGSAEESVKSKLKPEEFELLKNHFNCFYNYLIEHVKEFKKHNLEKYRKSFEIIFFIEFSNFINHNEYHAENLLSNKFLIEQFIYQRFFFTNLIFTALFASNHYLERLLQMDTTKYPDELFEKADEIYKDNSKLTFEKALAEAIKLFPGFKDIDPKSQDFYNINDSYKKYRSKKFRSRRLIKK